MTFTFYEQLQQDTAAERDHFMTIPLIRRAVAEGVDMGAYQAFLTAAYHHVKHTCPLLGLALSRCGLGDEEYRAALLAYLDEEKGHELWILDDIAAVGGDREAVRTGLAALPVRVMVAYAYHLVDRVSPYALLGMVHVLEGMSVALARAAADAIAKSLQAGMAGRKGGFSYLRSHGQLDEDHVEMFAQLLDAIDTPQRRQLVIQSAKDFYRLYGDIFRELSHV